MAEEYVIDKKLSSGLTFVENDENQNDITTTRIKQELDETEIYQTHLETILNHTKQIQQDENYFLKSDIKEEPYFDNNCSIINELNKYDASSEEENIFNENIVGVNDLDKLNTATEISRILQSENCVSKIDYCCQYCNYKATELSSLKNHSVEHKHEPKKLRKTKTSKNPKKKTSKKPPKTHFRKCSYCDYISKDKEDWSNHRTSQHSKSMTRKCMFCDFITNSATYLKLHINRHTKELLYKCQYCSYETVLLGHLKRHINSVHTKSIKYPCRHCDFVATDFGSVKRHIERKHEKVVISGKINLQNEPKIEHNTNAMTCSNDDLKEMLSRRKRISRDKPFQCQYCDYHTPFLDYLNIHINSRHTQNTLYKCQYCDYQATKLYTLRCHVNSKHTKKVLYKCELCNLETTRSNILKRHIQRIHVNKIFNCEYCSYVAKKEGHMRNHLRKKHQLKSKKQELEDEVKVDPELIEIENIKFEPEMVKCE